MSTTRETYKDGNLISTETIRLTPLQEKQIAIRDLKQSDADDLPRILEDILALLVADGLNTKRLPQAAREKLLKRKKLREKL